MNIRQNKAYLIILHLSPKIFSIIRHILQAKPIPKVWIRDHKY